MPDSIPLSASDLRNAMRDPRYWQSSHPERADYFAWVSDGWRQLEAVGGQPGSDGVVWVNPYTRRRHGQTEDVSGHYRYAGGSSGESGTAGNDAGATVAVEDQPTPDIERRYTARNASGELIGRCERLADGSQFCTLVLPDGHVAVQQLEAGDGEFTPVAAPALAFGFPIMLGSMTALYNYLQNWQLAARGEGAAADTPFMLFYRGFEGTQADVRVTVGILSPERVNEFCPKTAEFEERLAEVASAIPSEGLTPQRPFENPCGSASRVFSAPGALSNLPMQQASAASDAFRARKIPRESSAAGILKRSLSNGAPRCISACAERSSGNTIRGPTWFGQKCRWMGG